MFSKSNNNKEPLLTAKSEAEQYKNELASIEAEIIERQEIINSFFLPYKDIMAKIKSLNSAIAFEKNNFGSEGDSKRALAQLEREAVNVDQTCRAALKKSGQLDKFAELNERKMKLLKGDTEESQYQPPSVSKTDR